MLYTVLFLDLKKCDAFSMPVLVNHLTIKQHFNISNVFGYASFSKSVSVIICFLFTITCQTYKVYVSGEDVKSGCYSYCRSHLGSIRPALLNKKVNPGVCSAWDKNITWLKKTWMKTSHCKWIKTCQARLKLGPCAWRFAPWIC